MEVQIPLETAMSWIGGQYDPEFDIYQFEFGADMIQVQLFEEGGYAKVLATKEFSVEVLTECSDYFSLIGIYSA
jgi:hypothetical protein